jgi:5'-nucleotidase
MNATSEVVDSAADWRTEEVMQTCRCTLVVLLILIATVALPAADVEPFHLMVVNDDGVDAPGMAALVAALAEDPAYRVTVVAPATQQSGAGSSLTLRRTVTLTSHDPIAGVPTWSVDATPATTTRVGLLVVLAEDPPDLIVSGINKGENVGRIAWYSGTVGAAREAVLAGFPAVAFSLQMEWSDPAPDFAAAARWAKPVIDVFREHGPVADAYFNVNIPKNTAEAKGYRVCRMGLEKPQVAGFEVVGETAGARVLESRWAPAVGLEPGSDTAELHRGWVTITPLTLDSTSFAAMVSRPELLELMGSAEDGSVDTSSHRP